MQVVTRDGNPALQIDPNFEDKIRMKQQALTEIRKAEDEIKKQLDAARSVSEILSRLVNSWKDKDPGKYYGSYFFLKEYEGTLKRVVVRELLSSEDLEFKGSLADWNEFNRMRDRPYPTRSYNMVPPWFPVVNLDEVAKYKCPDCNEEHNLIEGYAQTFDSSDGDVWEKWRIVICGPKPLLVWKDSKGNRF